MKRIIPALLSLALVLAACGVPAAENTPAVTPEPTAYPASDSDFHAPSGHTPPPPGTPQPTRAPDEPLPEGFELPDPGFEPESFWLSEPYGEQGQALLLLRGAGSGGVEFRCWHSCCALYGGGQAERCLSTMSFGAETGADGLFGIYIDRDDEVRLSVDGDTLTITYPEDGLYADYPSRFYRCGDEDARCAWRNMPYNNEARIPLPATSSREEILSMPGVVQTGEESYELGDMAFSYRENYALEYVSVTAPGTGFSIRGLDVGSCAGDILASFPSDIADFAAVKAGETDLYGTDGFNSSRASFMLDYEGQMCFYLLDTAHSHVFFYLDKEGTVERIEYSNFL